MWARNFPQLTAQGGTWSRCDLVAERLRISAAMGLNPIPAALPQDSLAPAARLDRIVAEVRRSVGRWSRLRAEFLRHQRTEFSADSPLEQAGFELLVPLAT